MHIRKKVIPAVVLVAIPLAFFLLLEGVVRVEYRLRHGYSYGEALSYLPDPDLVFRPNPHHYALRDHVLSLAQPSTAFSSRDGQPRLWVLGGSTSAPQPDGSDWPSVLQRRLPQVRVINMALVGYGTSQMLWLYQHFEGALQPEIVLIFEGWNGRGAMSSPYGWRPANAYSQYDSGLQRASAALMNLSAFYGGLWHLVDYLRPKECRALARPRQEFLAWIDEYDQLAHEMSQRHHRTYIVLFPGLAMREDAREVLKSDMGCPATTWPQQRAFYEERIAALQAIAQRHRITLLDVRQDYFALSRNVHVSYFEDFVHQTSKGNRFLADVIVRALSREGEPSTGASSSAQQGLAGDRQ